MFKNKIQGDLIRSQDIHILRNQVMLMISVLSIVLLVVYIKLGINQFLNELFLSEFLKGQVNLIKFLVHLAIVVMFASSLIYLSTFVFKGFYQRILTKQRLALMIENSQFYIVEKYAKTEKLLDIFEYRQVTKNYLYYPKFYVYYKKGKYQISILLDGSKYQDKYLNLAKDLENTLAMQCVDKYRKDVYMVYELLDKKVSSRLILNRKLLNEDVKANIVPLSQSINWQLNKVPHALITGGTGGGKSSFMYYLVRTYLKMGADLVILDPKRADLSYLKNYLGTTHVAFDNEKIADKLAQAVEIMNGRYDEMINSDNYQFGADYTAYNMLPIIIIFDEFTACLSSVDKSLKKEIEKNLTELVMKGRQAGVFLNLATQRADASVLNGAIRDQLGLRVSLGALSDEGYRMTFGHQDKQFIDPNKDDIGKGYIYLQGVSTQILDYESPLLTADYNFIEDIEAILNIKAGDEHV